MTLPSPTATPRVPSLRPARLPGLAVGLGVAGFIASRLPRIAASVGDLRLHGPDLRLLAAQPPVLQAHIYAALAAVLVGAGLMALRKGRRLHRLGGWTWSLLMGLTAVTSLFVTTITPGRWSFVHLFSLGVLIGLPLAVAAARRHDARRHRLWMMRLFYGVLLVAGAFTFIPGRLMWRLFVG